MLKQTAVHSWHETHGAKMVPFAGWHMPLAYPTGAIREHNATREAAGIFDISHMGRLSISGNVSLLDAIISNNIVDVPIGGSTYGLLCKEDGGILDDVFVFRLGADRFVAVVNASNTAKAVDWFRGHISPGLELSNRTEETSMFALQGPRAIQTISSVAGVDAEAIPRFGVAEQTVGRTIWQISRTGYTGEDGVEIVVPAVDSMAVWSALCAPEHVTPAGLAARDSLRFEPGFPLYGHEIDEDRNPVEARLTWACDLSRPFIGRDAILEAKRAGVRRKLVTFRMTERGVPRQACRVLDEAGREIGTVVTGMYAPTINAFAGNAYVDLEYSKIGSTIGVEICGRAVSAEIVKRPLYRPAYRD